MDGWLQGRSIMVGQCGKKGCLVNNSPEAEDGSGVRDWDHV